MTNQEIINLTRYQLDDTEVTYKWSDVELISYLNDAQKEACRRAYLLINHPSIVKVTGSSNVSFDSATKKITKSNGGFSSGSAESEVNTFEKDDQITISGTVSNNGIKTIVSVSDTEIVVSETLVDESGTSAVIEAIRTVYRIPVNASIHTYRLHPKVLSVVRARLDSLTYPLRQRSLFSLDHDIAVVDIDINYDYYSWYYDSWEDLTGYPYAYMEEQGFIRIISPPISNDILWMIVSRLPKKEFTVSDLSLSPEIPEAYHSDLHYWMLNKAFSKPDAELQDLVRAKENENKFEGIFGKRPSALTELNRRRFAPNTSMRLRELGF